MNPVIKDKWVARLRSGQDKQVSGPLHCNNGGFCVLGVLADIYVQETGEPWLRTGNANYYLARDNFSGDYYSTLPKRVKDWAGLDVHVHDIMANLNDRFEEGTTVHVHPFPILADWIERYL